MLLFCFTMYVAIEGSNVMVWHVWATDYSRQYYY